MKRCPTCQKTFDDSMRFCQTDGTQLVQEAEPVDPYKTMVASADDMAAALGSPSISEPAASASAASASGSTSTHDDEPLQIPSEPIRSRSSASTFETRLAKPSERDEGQVMEIPPLVESTPPAPPKFNEPSPAPPSFAESAPPPSPFSSPRSGPQSLNEPRFDETTPAIPSPFAEMRSSSSAPPPSTPKHSEPPASTPKYSEPEPAAPSPKFAEPERPTASPAFNPFEAQAIPNEANMAQSEWTPPPAPESSWQNQPVGQNTPFQPPPAGAKLNQTMPIVSLIFGIISLCCYVSPVTGVIALITGFLGIKNVKNDPSRYGGKTLAIIGMILGGLLFVVGLVYWVFLIFFGGLSMMMQMLNK